jgi:hypothetical protein
MAKFGQLYLQKGLWNKKQIIPAAWVEEATTFKIDQAPDALQSRKDSSDWMQGYCYQFWRCRNNAFRADGAFGQYIIVLPEKDAVVAITSESPNMQDEINLVWKYLLPAMKDEALPANESMAENLKQKLASLALPLESGRSDSPVATRISGKTIAFEKNDRMLKSLIIDFMDQKCDLTIQADSASYKMSFGAGSWAEGVTERPGPSLTGPIAGMNVYKVTGSYTWQDDNTLVFTLRYTESPHHEKVTVRFDGDKVLTSIASSFAFSKYATELKAKVVAGE